MKSVLQRSRVAYSAVATLYENSLYLPHIIRQGLGGALLGMRTTGARTPLRQSMITWNVPFPTWSDSADLVAWLRSRGIHIHEGGHTFYIAPQDGLRPLIPSVAAFYPDQSGFKILKDFRHPLKARYLYMHRRSLRFLTRLIGTPRDQLVPANYMYRLGVGPRIWDLTCWESQGTRYTVFVVDHVAGRRPTNEQCQQFLHRLKDLTTNSRLRVLVPQWEQNSDFTPPDCSGNLIYSDALGRAQYVDFQNFAVAAGSGRSVDAHASGIGKPPSTIDGFGVEASLIRASQQRWAAVSAPLHERPIDLQGRLVLDIGCRTGLTIRASLSGGAKWAVGWCKQDEVSQLEESLLLSGATRFTLLDEGRIGDGRLEDQIPAHLLSALKGAVVFWRTDSTGNGLFTSLLRMPWDELVYDGLEHSSELSDPLRVLPPSQFEVGTRRGPGGGDSQVTLIRHRHS